MCRTSGKYAVRYESLEKALAESPETYGHLDLIAFGFPCQDISNANPKGQGIKGEKSSLFFEAMRIVEILIPKWILIENVPRLLSINEGQDFGIVLQTMAESGYGYCWNILDSQWFGVPQRRKRLFIAGRFGEFCPVEILAEPKGHKRNHKKNRKVSARALCLHTRTGARQNPASETFIASTIQASDYKKSPHGQYGNECNIIAKTINAGQRGTNYAWRDDYLAEINAEGKRKIAGTPRGLDTPRGIVIGNGITVPVMEWIGKRIIRYELKGGEE